MQVHSRPDNPINNHYRGIYDSRPIPIENELEDNCEKNSEINGRKENKKQRYTVRLAASLMEGDALI